MPEQAAQEGQRGSSSRGSRRHRRGRGRGRGGQGRGGGNPTHNGGGEPEGPAENTQPPSSHSAQDARGDNQATRSRPGGSRGHRYSRGRGGQARGSGRVPNQNQNPTIPGARPAFGGHLTSTAEAGPSTEQAAHSLSGDATEFVPGRPVAERRNRQPKPRQRRMSKSTAPDLTTRIHEDIDSGNYECGICTDDITRRSKIWAHERGCWTVAHLSCVKEWFKKADRERENGSSWRCPACNSSIDEPPAGYHCWCGKEPNPRSIAGIAPHSCGQTCSKPREKCPHPCSLQCHAGPCPPCTVMGPPEPCFCGKQTSTKRCIDTDYEHGWSCGEPCGDLLPCGQHFCGKPCHGGLCGSCEIPIPSVCYCGKTQKEMPCEMRADIRQSFNHGQVAVGAGMSEGFFEGSFECGNECGRQFDCGKHSCKRTCHVQDEDAPHCPYSPDLVTTCPCGKTPLAKILDKPRDTCEEEVPHCSATCDRILACGHRCTKTCHTDACGPCFETVDISCRCGRVTSKSICLQGQEEHKPICMRVCRAHLNCGRHECGDRCCPGEKKAAERRKNKNTNINDIEPEHICIRVCDRLLKCGRHRCQQTCHKGQCNSCLEAVFEEISCACGRTVLQPPQPCGTGTPECRYNCTRVRPCRHNIPHTCHTDEFPCPKCPFLVSKECMCGKKTMLNQPCWLTEVRCGQVCGNKLKCGYHTCKKLCHRPGECEDAGISGSHCRQPCGKLRNLCGHVCTDHCHAPFACSEDEPCKSKAILLCACQTRKQETRCMASSENPYPSRKTLECDEECLRLQRNRKLAEALHIDPASHTDDHIPFSAETLKMYTSNPTWAQAKEKDFRIFAADAQLKRKRFDPMPSHQRAFIHALAEDFGFDTLSEDPEPYRHVSVFKTPKFVGVPMKTLAQSIRIRNAKVKPGTVGSDTVSATTVPATRHEPFNALLLTVPRFGLTAKELDDILGPELGKFENDVAFTTNFLPGGDEIVIRITARATGTPWRMTGLEKILADIKQVVSRTAVTAFKVVDAVALCTVDTVSGTVIRSEQGGMGTWNTVVSRAAKRGGGTGEPSSAPISGKASPAPAFGTSSMSRGAGVAGGRGGGGGWGSIGGSGFAGMSSVPSTMPTRNTGFVALKLKKKEKKKEEVKRLEEPVAEDWETAAEGVDAGKEKEKEVGQQVDVSADAVEEEAVMRNDSQVE